MQIVIKTQFYGANGAQRVLKERVQIETRSINTVQILLGWFLNRPSIEHQEAEAKTKPCSKQNQSKATIATATMDIAKNEEKRVYKLVLTGGK